LLKVTGGSFGFSKLVTATVNYQFGRKEGTFHAGKAQFLEDLLDDARQIHVILHDTAQRRAWHTDGERLILHSIIHQHTRKPYRVDGEPITIVCAEPDQLSVSSAVLKNANLVLRRDQHLSKVEVKEKRFIDEFQELFERLEGLQAELGEVSEAGLEMKLPWIQKVQGWSYVNWISHKAKMTVQEVQLKSTCGQWPVVARDLNAVVFLADNFNEVIRPGPTTQVCLRYRAVPQGKDYLTMTVSSLHGLLTDNGFGKDHIQITSTGIQWLASPQVFTSCVKEGVRPGGGRPNCDCDKVQEFGTRQRSFKCKRPNPLPLEGAVIFGRRLFRRKDGSPMRALVLLEPRTSTGSSSTTLHRSKNWLPDETKLQHSIAANHLDNEHPAVSLYNLPNSRFTSDDCDSSVTESLFRDDASSHVGLFSGCMARSESGFSSNPTQSTSRCSQLVSTNASCVQSEISARTSIQPNNHSKLHHVEKELYSPSHKVDEKSILQESTSPALTPEGQLEKAQGFPEDAESHVGIPMQTSAATNQSVPIRENQVMATSIAENGILRPKVDIKDELPHEANIFLARAVRSHNPSSHTLRHKRKFRC
jgi:hypothetical protein